MTTTEKTESVPATANAPLPAVPTVLEKAKSIVGRIPRNEKEQSRRVTAKGERVTTLSEFDWTKVPVKHLASSKAAVALVIASENLARATLALGKAETSFAEVA